MKGLFLLVVLAVAACATPRGQSEPADLVAPGKQQAALVRDGWEIGPPVSATAPGLPAPGDTQCCEEGTWASFTAQMLEGDELRPVRNNAGIGFAVFRGGRLVGMFLTTIF